MRIVVDFQACQNGSRHRGIGRYTMALTQAMIAADRGHEFRLILSDAFPGTILPIRRAFDGVLAQEHILVCAMPGRTGSANLANAWRTRTTELLRARFIAALDPDWLFLPSLFEGFHDAMVTSVEPAAHRTAVTIFDFIPIEYAEQYLPGAPIRAAYHRKLRDAAAADLLLPISHYVAGEARARLGVAEDRIVPVPLGVEAMFTRPAPGTIDRAALMRRYGIDRPFVLNTSPFEYRKNMPGLIAGFAAIPKALRDRHQLVIVGRMDDAARRAMAALTTRAGLRDDAVVLAGFVPDEDLVALYGECALFAFPSLSEGFGLPVIEAMACGAPVIGSSTTSIPEVIGRADLLCDPADPPSIGAAMARVLGDPALRADLREWGFARSGGFTWDAAAATTLDAFERIAPRDAITEILPAARPAASRPGLCLVVPTIAAGDPQGAYARILLPELARDFAVTLACPEGAFDDERMAAIFEARDLLWFERNAPRFDHIVYLADCAETGRIAALMTVHPGALILSTDGMAAPTARDKVAAGGFAALLTARSDVPVGAALRAYATGTIVAGTDAVADAARLAAAMPGFSHMVSLDRERRFAASLPAAVRDVRPTSDDLARLARAVARNEAQDRAPLVFLDLGGLGTAEAARPHRSLIRAIVAAGGPRLRAVRMEGDRLMLANSLLGESLGATGLADEPLALRAGDRLIGIDRLGGFSVTASLRAAGEMGVSLRHVIAGNACDDRIAEAALGHDQAKIAPDVPATLATLIEAGVRIDVQDAGDHGDGTTDQAQDSGPGPIPRNRPTGPPVADRR